MLRMFQQGMLEVSNKADLQTVTVTSMTGLLCFFAIGQMRAVTSFSSIRLWRCATLLGSWQSWAILSSLCSSDHSAGERPHEKVPTPQCSHVVSSSQEQGQALNWSAAGEFISWGQSGNQEGGNSGRKGHGTENWAITKSPCEQNSGIPIVKTFPFSTSCVLTLKPRIQAHLPNFCSSRKKSQLGTGGAHL